MHIGKNILDAERAEVIECLFQTSDCFAWSVDDIKGIDRSIIMNHLNIYPDAQPKKQERTLPQNKIESVERDVDKLRKDGFLRIAHYLV